MKKLITHFVSLRIFPFSRLVALCLISSVFLVGNKVRAEKPRGLAKQPSTQTMKAKVNNGIMDGEIGTFYRYKLNTFLGMMVVHQPGFTGGEQFGFAPWSGVPLYLGPAIDFNLFSPGFLFSTLGGGWYELRVYGSPRLSVALGALGGIGFTGSTSQLSSQVAEAFLETAIVQDIDDLWSLRGEVRPGIVGGDFAFMVNFNVSFRFY